MVIQDILFKTAHGVNENAFKHILQSIFSQVIVVYIYSKWTWIYYLLSMRKLMYYLPKRRDDYIVNVILPCEGKDKEF